MRGRLRDRLLENGSGKGRGDIQQQAGAAIAAEVLSAALTVDYTCAHSAESASACCRTVCAAAS